MGQMSQSETDYILRMVEQGKLTTDEANVELVRAERFRLVQARIPAQVRATLNAAVKSGQMKHMKKDGHKPEVYYHPTFEYLAVAARNKHAAFVSGCAAGVFARPEGDE